MNELSNLRINMMRGLYLLISLGMGSIIWPLMFNHGEWSVMHSVANSFLAALSLLCLLGIKYPVQMLPLLIFEFTWKTIWVVAIALPAWLANSMSPEMRQTAFECLLGVIICPIVIPWGYVWANYVKKPGDRWTPARAEN